MEGKKKCNVKEGKADVWLRKGSGDERVGEMLLLITHHKTYTQISARSWRLSVAPSWCTRL